MLETLIGALAAITLASPVQAQNLFDQYIERMPQTQVAVQDASVPTKKRKESLGIKTNAASVFVADVASGKVLFAQNEHKILPIASLTKLMTAMVLLDQKIDLTATVELQADDFDRESKSVFKIGEQLTYGELLESMLVGSVNASANALARATLGREEFVAAMNAKARELKLDSPHYADPSGLDPRNTASAADIAAIITHASGYPQITAAMRKPEVTIRGHKTGQAYTIKTTNLLLSTFLNKEPYSVVAAKTGSLPEAGYCMAQITQRGDGSSVVAVELGDENHFDRFQDIKALTNWAFDTYEWN
ncbi:MAG: serine hydrolase [Patescibacteria group bacterium]|nr:serine hydrolase [Patescibacteria group bacterium]